LMKCAYFKFYSGKLRIDDTIGSAIMS
jgi:hypothetical protein